MMKKNFILGVVLHLFLALKPFLYYKCFKVMTIEKFMELEWSRFLVMLGIGAIFCGTIFYLFSICMLKFPAFLKKRLFLILLVMSCLFMLDYMYVQSVFTMPPWCGNCQDGHYYGENIWERFLCEWRWQWQSITFLYAFCNSICFTWILTISYLKSNGIIKKEKYLSFICSCLLLGFFVGNVGYWFLSSIADGFYMVLLYCLLLFLGLLWIEKRVNRWGIFVILCFGIVGLFFYKPLQISYHISRLGSKNSHESYFILVQAKKDAVIPLVEAYFQGNYNAVDILYHISDKRAIPTFIDMLSDKYMIVRTRAVGALNKIGDEGDRKKVVDILHNEVANESYEVRLWAAKELVTINRVLAIATFRKEMNSGNFDSALKAATELANLREKDGISYLIKVIQPEQKYQDWDGFGEIIHLLERVTGQKIGWGAKKWKEWWEKNKEVWGEDG